MLQGASLELWFSLSDFHEDQLTPNFLGILSKINWSPGLDEKSIAVMSLKFSYNQISPFSFSHYLTHSKAFDLNPEATVPPFIHSVPHSRQEEEEDKTFQWEHQAVSLLLPSL